MNHFEEYCLFLALTNKSAWQQQVELVWQTATTMWIYVKCFLSVFSYLVLIKKIRNLSTFGLASQHVENSFRFKMYYNNYSVYESITRCVGTSAVPPGLLKTILMEDDTVSLNSQRHTKSSQTHENTCLSSEISVWVTPFFIVCMFKTSSLSLPS